MTNFHIENTSWAKRFAHECPESFLKAMKIVSDPGLEVVIINTDSAGRNRFAIESVKTPGFWLDAKIIRNDAVKLCNRMNWKIKDVDENRS